MTGRLRFLSGWTCALLLTGFPAQVGHSQTLPEQLTADNVMSFIEANNIESAADLIQSLPPLHKRHVAFVFDSEAIQPELVSREHPRVVSWGADARFILSWASNPDSSDNVEFLQHGAEQWEAGVIDFSGDEPALSNPAVCSTCHGDLNRPIWGDYDRWLGTDGGKDLTSSQRRGIHSDLSASTNPKLSPLELSDRYPLTSTATGDTGVFQFGFVNELNNELSARHAEVLFNRLKKRDDFATVAEQVICQESRWWRIETDLFPMEDHYIGALIDGDELKPVQGGARAQPEGATTIPSGIHYASNNGTISQFLQLLFLHDAWSRDTRVSDLYASLGNEQVSPQFFVYLNYQPGAATAEQELLAGYNYFATQGQALLNARIDKDLHCRGNPGSRGCNIAKDAVFSQGHFTSMAPRVCSVLRQDTDQQLSQVRISDGNAGEDAGEIVFTVTLDPPPVEAVTVRWYPFEISLGHDPKHYRTVLNGLTGWKRALRESDFVMPSFDEGTLSFNAGQASQQITVDILDDGVPEPPEIFKVLLASSSSNAVIVDGLAFATIDKGLEQALPQFTSASGFTVVEGETAVATLTATDTDTPAADLQWSIPSGTAGGTDGGKFAITSGGALSFASAKDYEAPDDADNNGVYQVTVQVGAGLNTAAAELTVTLSNRNEVPVANAGADQTGIQEGATVTLAGSGSDPDAGDELTYAWTQTGGTSVTLSDAAAAAPTFTAPTGLTADATLIFSLRVTDKAGLSHQDSVSVTVKSLPVATVEAGTTPVTEGTAATFTVTLGPAAAQALTVSVSVTESGSMVSGTPPVSVSFAEGATSATLSVPTAADSVVEADSTVTATVTSGTGYTVGTAASATVTMEDDDAATFTVSFQPDSISEGEDVTLTVAISDGVSFAQDQTISLAVSGTASASDYTGLPTELTLPAGASAVVLHRLSAATDEEEEQPETLTVTASHGGSAIGSATVTINSVSRDATLGTLSVSGIDIGTFSGTVTSYEAIVANAVTATTVTATATHPAATVTVEPAPQVTLAEGANEIVITVTAEDGKTTRTYRVTVTRAGLPEASIAAASSPVTEGTAASFTVTLDLAAPETLTVAVGVTESGSALSGTPPASVAFAKGETRATLSVPTAADSVVEAGSTVTARVTSGTGYAVGTGAAASVTVEDDDTATFTVSAEPGTISEGESATLTVAIANGVTFADAQTISLAASGTASASDHTGVPETLTLAAGASSVTAALAAAEDQEEEEAETVTVTASHGGSAIGSATVTINSVSHDATLASLSLSGIDIGTFSDAVTSYQASVGHSVATTTVTATASYSGATLSIEPGSEVNLAVGANEIRVTVRAEDGTTTKTYTVTVTRAGLPEASIAAASSPVTEGTAASFTVTLDQAAPEALTVAVGVTESGSALSGTPPASVAFAKGETRATLSVPTAADSVVEADSTVTARVTSGTGYAVGTEAAASVTVEDDDTATLTLSALPAMISEGESTTLELAITGGVTFGRVMTYQLTTSGTASASDHTGVPERLTLAPGESSVTATLQAVADQVEEEAETVTVEVWSFGKGPIVSATVTINSVSRDATLGSLSLSGIDIGTFSDAVTSYQASVGHSVETTTVTVTASHSGATLSIEPGSEVNLAVGANEIRITVRAEDGKTTKTYTVTVTRSALPVVSIVAVEERVSEAEMARFTVSRTGPTAGSLDVQVLFTSTTSERVRTLTVRLPPGQSSVTKRVQAGDNTRVQDDVTVTWTLGAGEGYTVSAENASAAVVLEENDFPAFAVSVEPAEIAEGESATVTVAITNGVTFQQPETITLAVSGTASAADYSGVPETLRLYAFSTRPRFSAMATLRAAPDQEEEAAETVTITASHGGAPIGSATVTISDGEQPALTAQFAGMPATHDGEAAFKFELRFSEEIEISYVTLRDTAFQITGGAVRGARRLARSSNLGWEITVQPASEADVELKLPVTTNCAAAGAICTAGGAGLSQEVNATVGGPGAEDQDEGFPLAPQNSSPSGIWSDGETAWVADLDDARLYVYRRSDGERQPTKDIATDPAPMGLWSDGEALWVAGLGGGLRAHRLADGSRLAARDLALEANTAPAGVWSDGETAWVADWLGDTVPAYRLSDGRREAGRDVKLAGGNLMPVGLWADGETLWVADWRERVYAYRLSDGSRDPARDIEAGETDTDPTGLWSGGGTLLATGWASGEVRAYRLPEVVADKPGKQPGAGLTARAVSLPAIADTALQAAIGAALGKAPGEAVSPQELAGLEALTARSAGVRDLSGLEQAVRLKDLDLGFNPLADLRPLAGLPALESLSLDGAAADLQALAPLARLQRLSLRHNGLDELGPLAGLTSLAELDLGDNRIADLRPLAGLANLAVLRADRNQIADLWPLASLAGLEALELGANRVRDLQPLAGLARLQSLRLGGNGLAELHPLAGLEGLRDLVLAGNAVADLRALSHLDGLRRLDLRGNPVGDLRPLRALKSLAWMHVAGARIEDLGPLNGLPGLTVAGRTTGSRRASRAGKTGERVSSDCRVPSQHRCLRQGRESGPSSGRKLAMTSGRRMGSPGPRLRDSSPLRDPVASGWPWRGACQSSSLAPRPTKPPTSGPCALSCTRRCPAGIGVATE